MKSKISDVRDYLCKALAELADSDAAGEELNQKIERAKATSLVANSYIAAVKVEIDAIRLMDDTGRLPVSVEAGDVPSTNARLIPLEGRRRA